jgi:hypothetical protein
MNRRHYLDTWVIVTTAFLIALFGGGYWYSHRNPTEPAKPSYTFTARGDTGTFRRMEEGEIHFAIKGEAISRTELRILCDRLDELDGGAP